MHQDKIRTIVIKPEYVICTYVAVMILILVLSQNISIKKIVFSVIFSWAIIIFFIHLLSGHGEEREEI